MKDSESRVSAIWAVAVKVISGTGYYSSDSGWRELVSEMAGYLSEGAAYLVEILDGSE